MSFEWMEYEENDSDKYYWKARSKLGMTAETIKRDVNHLKNWLKNHPYLPELTGANEDLWLENYILLNKNDMEKVKSNLETYFKIRTTVPEAFEERHPFSPSMQKSFQSTCVALLPKLMESGHMVAVYHHLTRDISEFEVIPLGKRLIAMIEVQLQYTRINRVGTVAIVDLHNSSIGHLTRYRPLRLIRLFFNSIWKAYPERVSQIHIIHPPFGLQTCLAFFRPFLKEKIKKRIMVHSNLESLFEWVPQKYLPQEYGGELGPLEELNCKWQTIMLDNYDWLEVCGKKHKIDDAKCNQNETKTNNKIQEVF